MTVYTQLALSGRLSVSGLKYVLDSGSHDSVVFGINSDINLPGEKKKKKKHGEGAVLEGT